MLPSDNDPQPIIIRNDNRSSLPWILLLIILGLGVWGAAEFFEASAEPEMYTQSVVANSPERMNALDGYDPNDANYAYRPIFENYLEFTANMEGEMGLDHEFSHEALTLLTNSVLAIANAKELDDDDFENRSQRALQLADDITKEPFSGTHADQIRMAAIQITNLLESVNNKAFGGMYNASITELRSEAQQITSASLTLNQKEDVRSFLTAARRVLSEMM